MSLADFWQNFKSKYSQLSYNAVSSYRIAWKRRYENLGFNHTNHGNRLQRCVEIALKETRN